MVKSLVEMLKFMSEWKGDSDTVALLLSVGQYKRICNVAAQAGEEQCQNIGAWMELAGHLRHCQKCSSISFCETGKPLYTLAYRGLLALEQYNEYEDKPKDIGDHHDHYCGYCGEELMLIKGKGVCLTCKYGEGDAADRIIMG